ncbi:hypothetical protein [Kitasatospora cathayae]|uniref:Uncharacterized protein n=1 Tax=Kitasatospora cathayae TaxID=3004092 RepID=A0ABY7QGV6_9ACTN|nr:hypothetical protein [Kitasatospora sp. HUAS 3-15]WBP91943.1 hypothetical protein O1G21_39830 [Kitasatospora sp. HUAS 3-15]
MGKGVPREGHHDPWNSAITPGEKKETQMPEKTLQVGTWELEEDNGELHFRKDGNTKLVLGADGRIVGYPKYEDHIRLWNTHHNSYLRGDADKHANINFGRGHAVAMWGDDTEDEIILKKP